MAKVFLQDALNVSDFTCKTHLSSNELKCIKVNAGFYYDYD